MKYVDDASQVMFLVLAVLLVVIVVKVFFLDGPRKKSCALCGALYADKVAHQQFHDSLKR